MQNKKKNIVFYFLHFSCEFSFYEKIISTCLCDAVVTIEIFTTLNNKKKTLSEDQLHTSEVQRSDEQI